MDEFRRGDAAIRATRECGGRRTIRRRPYLWTTGAFWIDESKKRSTPCKLKVSTGAGIDVGTASVLTWRRVRPAPS